MVSPVLGIDLGTTNSVVAIADNNRVRVLRDEEGHLLTPSLVSMHPSGQILVGYPARERRLIDARSTVFSIKRLIGRPFRSPEVRTAAERLPFVLEEGSTGGVVVRVRDETYSLPEISSHVLRHLRAVAEQALGQTCVNAVITVPANFNELQRMATRDAGRLAGLNVLRILNEPTAAALAYGYSAQTRQRLAVYDLGGGTFDISILELSGDVIEVIATAGDTYLGGDDVDNVVAERMAATFLHEHAIDLRQDVQTFERVRMAAEWIKCQLSMLESAEATVKEIAYGEGGAPIDLVFRLTRGEIDPLIFPLIGRTFDICEDALKLAGVRPTQLDGVILVGGQTRTPKVREMVAEYFGMEPRSSVDPDLVVAQGAAIQGFVLSGTRASLAPKPMGRTLPSGSAPPPPDRTLEYRRPAPVALASEPPAPKRSDTPFDDLPTTVSRRDDDEALTKVSEIKVPIARVSPSAPSARSTLTGVGARAPTDAVPKPAKVPTEAVGFPLVIDEQEVTEEDIPAALKVEPRPSPPPPPVPATPPAATVPAPSQSQFPTALHGRAPLLLDVTPHTLCVETAGGYCEAIIERNAPIPTEQTRVFATSQDNQVAVRLRICQGEARRTDDNQVLGQVELLGLRGGRRGEVSVAVTFVIDADGTLDVKAIDRTTNKAQATRIDLVGALGEAELARVRARTRG